jgi:predicted ATPase/DNA-binding SARP family transcriptional activator
VLQVSVLGPVEVHRDGALVAVPGGKSSELLVRLALEPGVTVSTERLLDDLWAEAAGTTRRNTLQSKVAMLRRALGDPPVVGSTDGGYDLDVRPGDVDALAVLEHAAVAARLLEAGDLPAAADRTASALGRFRGDVLPAAGDGPWVAPHRARLEEARITLLHVGASARMDLGDLSGVIGDLEAAVLAHPFQEGLWEVLITAQYRAGRQADALATYQRVRTLLAEELGLDPGPDLQSLEQRVLGHDPSLAAPEPRATVAAVPAPTGNLPSLATELVGRDHEVQEVAGLVARSRLVELVGPGGIGKTAVALAVGRHVAASGDDLAGGVWLARLETAVTADDVVDTLIAAFGVSGGEAALFERLRTTAGLVIIDNCEQVVEVAADLVTRVLDAGPGMHVLCTSQVPLDVEGEVLVELAPLELDDAVELFRLRASARRPSRPLDADDDALGELCRSLDGLPLAIELAAARTRTLSVAEITRRLDDRFVVLSDPTSRRPERRRALRSTIAWSYELLFPDDQRGLWALATFAGGAPLPALEAVLGALDVPAEAAIDVVGRLASRSLVIADESATGNVRYRLLDSIRAYALEAMADAAASERAAAAHAEWFAAAADASTDEVRSARQAEALAFARVERANVDAALAWAVGHDPRLALRLVDGFGWAWIVLGDSRGAQRALTALDAVGDDASAHDRGGALLLAGWIEASHGDLEHARRHVLEATALAEADDDQDLQARAAYYLAYVVSHDGDFREGLELTDRSAALLEHLDRPWDLVANGLFATRAAISAGDVRRAVAARDDVARWLAMVDDPWLEVRYEAMLGELARVQRRFDDAVLHIGRAAGTSERLGFQQTEAYQVSSLGRAQSQAGDPTLGAETLERAVAKAEAIGDVRMAALARVHLGRVRRGLGEADAARAALELAATWHRSVGGGEQAALGDCLLAALDAADGVPGAEARLTSILHDAGEAGDAPVEVFALDALARLAADALDLEAARSLVDEADARMAEAAHFIAEHDRVDAHAVRSRG